MLLWHLLVLCNRGLDRGRICRCWVVRRKMYGIIQDDRGIKPPPHITSLTCPLFLNRHRSHLSPKSSQLLDPNPCFFPRSWRNTSPSPPWSSPSALCSLLSLFLPTTIVFLSRNHPSRIIPWCSSPWSHTAAFLSYRAVRARFFLYS